MSLSTSQSRCWLTTGDKFIPITVEENDIFEGIKQILKIVKPNWPIANIVFKTFTDGITNKLVACQLNGDTKNGDNTVLIRIYGNKTDLLIDRNTEIRNLKTLNVLGLAPKIYAVFQNGLAYQYFPGVTLDTYSVLDDKIWPLVARQMAKMHKVQLNEDVKKEPFVWDKIEQFLSLLPEPFSDETKQSRFVNSFGSITRLRIEFERLKSHLTKTESPIVFAHNDLLLGNVIYNQDEGIISFIDYEYAAYNYQAFDIANHFNEYVGLTIEDINYDRYPSKDIQLAWIHTYLTEYLNIDKPSTLHVETVYKDVQQHCLLSHFLWGVWSLVQYELSDIDFDFGRYAEIRFSQYFKLKDKVFKEQS